MSVAFADATFYIALLVVRDSNHEKAEAIARLWDGKIVTTEYVLTEVANHLGGSSNGRRQFGKLLFDIQSDSQSKVVKSESELWTRAAKLYAQRLDKQWSLIDCISFLVMQEHGITESLTADHHFQQAGFRALLLE
jgi:predicted nucleic acid-binding protein